MVGRGHARRAATDSAPLSDVLFGRNPVLALLKGGGRRTDEIAVLAGATGPLAEVVARARRAGVKVSYRTRDQLTAIAGSPHHQGVVARVAAAEYAELDDLLEIPAERGEPAFFLALDQVQDPRNLGAVLRTADAFAVHGVIVPKHHQVGLTGAAAKTAMGVAPWDADLTGPLCLVLGSEGGGLRPLIGRTCDVLLSVPMLGRVGSLNVSAAAATLCYEVVRQRTARR